jgi:isoleucyl-tRNA synthetase
MYNAKVEEEKILKYWDEHDCFNKSITNRPEDKTYHFYDGPPFATGLPHYGHIVASLMKDIVPRFWTMQGYRVERKWGWDCHGLPIENIVEKELGLKSKKDIEAIGIDKFNETCRAKVSAYAEEWQKIIRRLGRWVDMKHAYWTMDLNYMESVWAVFKELWDKGLIYEGYKSMHICPRCETTLSQQEVAEGYKDIKDLSVVAKFELVEEPGTFVLAWTTTPWTLPGNVALAVREDVEYVKVSYLDDFYILAKERVENIFKDKKFEIIKELKGSDLIGKKYRPLFDYYLEKDLPNKENLYTIVSADFVTTEDGTGVVHIAPAFGEDDMNVGKEKNLPFIQNVLMNGQFTDEVTDFYGMNVKPIDDPKKTDVEVIKYLAGKNLLFAKEQYEHSYPHCWRCDTPLINYATSSWFVNVLKIKERALPLAEKINWSPKHIKAGRFGKWLEGARDWSISRQRFWASVMPVWRCECGEIRAFGSIAELEEVSGQKITDLHKHKIDALMIPCGKCGATVKRVPDVLDTWFDSGSMPYAQMHYPFENKEKFEKSFPAEFIAEGIDQTRAWFYYLHLIAVATKNSPAYEQVIVNGIVLAEDGKKMSKRLQNYPDPSEVLDKYGADAMRYYLATSPVMEAENLNFSEAGVREIYNKVVNTLDNVFEFYLMYATQPVILNGTKEPIHILDKWILAKLQVLVVEVTIGMKEYELVKAGRPILEFITELSQWYVRRSRDRFKGDNVEDKNQAIATLHEVLLTLSQIMAPFTPFMADKIYLALTDGETSVHLTDWPVTLSLQGGPNTNQEWLNEGILKNMTIVRQIVEIGLSLRAEAGIKVRQPLSALYVSGMTLSKEFLDITAEELNIKEINFVKDFPEKVGLVKKETKDFNLALDIELTEELKKEGLAREIIRTINQMRKEQSLTITDTVVVKYNTDDELVKSVFGEFVEEIKKQTLVKEMVESTEKLEDKKIGEVMVGFLLVS